MRGCGELRSIGQSREIAGVGGGHRTDLDGCDAGELRTGIGRREFGVGNLKRVGGGGLSGICCVLGIYDGRSIRRIRYCASACLGANGHSQCIAGVI